MRKLSLCKMADVTFDRLVAIWLLTDIKKKYEEKKKHHLPI